MGATMQKYRLYIMNKRGKVMGAGNFQCKNDEAARACTKQLAGDDHDTELWRLVGSPDLDIRPLSAVSDHQASPMNRRHLHS
jgi:hypothetical protein